MPLSMTNYNFVTAFRQTGWSGEDAILIDAEVLARILDRSLTSIRRDDKAGRIPRPVTVGGARKWRIAEIKDWVQAGCPKRAAWETMRRPVRMAKAG